MTGLQQTLKSLKNTYRILEESKYNDTDKVYKVAHDGAINLALMALKNDIEMVEFRIEQEK